MRARTTAMHDPAIRSGAHLAASGRGSLLRPARRTDSALGSMPARTGGWLCGSLLGWLVAALAPGFAPSAQAQQQPVSSIPGLVVTMPPSPGTPPPTTGPPMTAPPMAAPPARPAPSPAMAPAKPAPAKRATPKPKAKPTDTKSARPAGPVRPGGGLAIVALVNDEPITAYEVDTRARFMAISGNIADRARAAMKSIAENPNTSTRLRAILDETIKANPGKSREQIIALFEARKKTFVLGLQRQAVETARAGLIPTLRKKALDELIEERLKLQEAKRLGITVSKDDVERAFKSVAERNKTSAEQLMAQVRAQGGDPQVMKDRFRATLAWREVVRRRYGHQISVSNREIDRFVETAPATGDPGIELQLHKIVLALPGKIDQRIIAQRLQEAEGLRRRFQSCKTTAALVKDTAAKFEDLGYRKATSVTEPTRSLLISARDGEMVPATLSGQGVELYAVCARRSLKVSDERRQAAEQELSAKQFDRLGQRHLHDLRKDALIEIR